MGKASNLPGCPFLFLNTMKKAVKTAGAKSAKAVAKKNTFDANIEADARRLESRAKEYGISLGEVCRAILSTDAAKPTQYLEAAKPERFLKWLESAPQEFDLRGDFAIGLNVELCVQEWTELLTFARRENTTLENALTRVVNIGLEQAHRD